MWNRAFLIGIWTIEVALLLYNAIIGLVAAATSLLRLQYGYQQM